MQRQIVAEALWARFRELSKLASHTTNLTEEV
jgi:hypothetical protein